MAAGRRVASDDRTLANLAAPALVFAPHPDDEVLGCGGTIALKAAAGAKVTVVVMTDGRTSHSGLVEPAALIQMRRSEAQQAAIKLGVRPDDYLFLNFEDQRLEEFSPAALQQVLALLERLRPQQVFVPHRRDRLSDHVATFKIVARALRSFAQPVALFEYPVWLWNTWPWTRVPLRGDGAAFSAARLARDITELAVGCRTRIDVRSVLPRKCDALAMYASQMRRPDDDLRWPVLADVSDGTFLDRFLTGVEIFRMTRLGH